MLPDQRVGVTETMFAVREPGGDTGLAEEALAKLGAYREFRGKHLDGQVPVSRSCRSCAR